MDALQVADMESKLRNEERYVRLSTPQDTEVFYQVVNQNGWFFAKWGIDVQLEKSDRKELVRLKAFPDQSQAVDYLVDHLNDPLKHRQLLLDT